jgi:error-prone DNA polymerase
VTGARVEDVRGIVSERERGGPYSSVTDLAARCGAGRDSLDRLAWAGACDLLVPGGRRKALWLLGVSPSGVTVDGATHRAGTGTSTRPAGAAPGGPMLRADDAQPLVRPSDSKGRRTRTVTGRRVPAPTVAPPVQLALPLDPGEAPALRTMTPWERLLADYGSTKITLAEHPLALMRADLDPDVLTSVELSTAPDGSAVRVAGLVVARQRPATAKGVTFMLLEDECGTINLVVPPPVHDACRLAVRAEPFVLGAGTLERREGVINVVVTAVHRLDRHDVPPGEVRHIEPQRTWSTEETAGDLRAVAPGAHSFGRRA